MMRKSHVLSCVVLLCALGLATWAQTIQTNHTPKTEPITLSELRVRGIQGELGYPFGTILKVNGVIIDNPKPDTKRYGGEPHFLRVTHVNGQQLAQTLDYPASYMPVHHAEKNLKTGDPFECVGYEVGGFYGRPDGIEKFIKREPISASYDDLRFHFSTRFIMVKPQVR